MATSNFLLSVPSPTFTFKRNKLPISRVFPKKLKSMADPTINSRSCYTGEDEDGRWILQAEVNADGGDSSSDGDSKFDDAINKKPVNDDGGDSSSDGESKFEYTINKKLLQSIPDECLQFSDSLDTQDTDSIMQSMESKEVVLAMAQFAVDSSKSKAVDDALLYLESVVSKLQNTTHMHKEDAVLYLQLHIIALMLKKGNVEGCISLLQETGTILENKGEFDSLIMERYHWISAQFYKYCEDYSKCHKHLTAYLKRRPLETIPEAALKDLALDFCATALLASDFFDFASVIYHPVVSKGLVPETEFLKEMLFALHFVNLDRYDQALINYRDDMEHHPLLLQKENIIRDRMHMLYVRKIALSYVLGIVPLQFIATETKFSMEHVEYILRKALQVGLISGEFGVISGESHISVFKYHMGPLLDSHHAQIRKWEMYQPQVEVDRIHTFECLEGLFSQKCYSIPQFWTSFAVDLIEKYYCHNS